MKAALCARSLGSCGHHKHLGFSFFRGFESPMVIVDHLQKLQDDHWTKKKKKKHSKFALANLRLLRCCGCKGCRQLLLPCEAMVAFLGGSGRLYAWWWLLGRRAMSSLGQKRSKFAAGIGKGTAASSRLLPMTSGGCYQEPLPLVVSGDSSGGGCCGGSSAIQQAGATMRRSSNQARENFAA